MTERMVSMPVGVVVEWREVDHPWQDHEWVPVAVIPGAGAIEEWVNWRAAMAGCAIISERRRWNCTARKPRRTRSTCRTSPR